MKILPLLIVVFLSGCTKPESLRDIVSDSNESIWAVDLVRTLPGQQDNYVASIEANWSNARKIAKQRGAILAYRAFVAPPDTSRNWDVMLMTEYADSTQWLNREETFRAIFESSEYVAVEPAAPSSQMREFFEGEVVLRNFVDK